MSTIDQETKDKALQRAKAADPHDGLGEMG